MTIIKYSTRKRGFTLLELLIVVSIIGMLTAMTVVVMRGIADQAQEEATVATIRKINGLLEARVEAFDRAFDQQGSFQQRYVTATDAILAEKRIFGVRPEVKLILAKKIAFRHNFPQRHEDLLKLGFAANGVTPVSDFVGDALKTAGRVIDRNGNQIADAVDATADSGASNVHSADAQVNDETVSSELLYWFLVKSGNFGSSSVAADTFSALEIADTDGDGLLEFIDGWGNPLRFYRWPTRMIDYDAPHPFQPILDPSIADATDTRVINDDERLYANVLMKGLPPAPTTLPNGATPREMLFTDPDDPIGRLYSEMERLNGLNGKPALAAEFSATLWYHTPETYHTPLIMSAGVDEELGLFEPSDTANGGHLASVIDPNRLDSLLDNLTNRNRRAGGRR